MTYRVLVTGSRDWPRPWFVHLALNTAYLRAADAGLPMIVVDGLCPTGADLFAYEWVIDMQAIGFPVDVEEHPADWAQFKKAAGFRRNAEMVNLGAQLCLAFIHNESRGANHTASLAERAGIETYRYSSKELIHAPVQGPQHHPRERRRDLQELRRARRQVQPAW